MEEKYFKGRGAQFNPPNPYLDNKYETEHFEALDETFLENSPTEFIYESPKKIVNKVDSPDVPLNWSVNPYQGCEHGCIYCYARNSHQYWGMSAGLDFERKIVVKRNAPALLEKHLRNPKWEVEPIMFSGNTDCYQPAERKFELTREMLKVMLKYKHPVGMITKNSLILRDLDVLQELAALRLVHVVISVTTLNEPLRQKMEPRTATGKKRIEVIAKLTEAGIPTTVLAAPILPGLNSHEIPAILKAASEVGALNAGYIIVRLNGNIQPIFEDWITKSYPDRAQKVLNQIKSCHGGSLNDSRVGTRMRGEGEVASAIRNLFQVARKKYFKGRSVPEYNLALYQKMSRGGQMKLF